GATATSSAVVLPTPRRAMESYAPRSTWRRVSSTAPPPARSPARGSEPEQRIEPDRHPGALAHRLHPQPHTGHERRAVVRGVAGGERLPRGGQQHPPPGGEAPPGRPGA